MSRNLPDDASKRIREGLFPWFHSFRRDLPWRKIRTPYTVWISETMLQQTRVETVIPYFERWLKEFPDCASLAAADQEQVLKCWEGLGYYARARNLHHASRQVVEKFGGKLPDRPEDLMSLKGIGPYTLAAVMSLAFDQPFAVLDGNVERVLARFCAVPEDIRKTKTKKDLQTLATRLLSDHPPALFNEAMMELGATVCTPGKPNCEICPLQQSCRAFKKGTPENFPFKSKKKPIPTVQVGAGVVWKSPDVFLIAKRKEKGMLGGLWEFPGGKIEKGESASQCVVRELKEELGIDVSVGKELVKVKHTYSHFHLRMAVFHCSWTGGEPSAIDCADFKWVTREECKKLPFSRADLKVLEVL